MGRAATFDNLFGQAFPSFGPERRGAPVLAFTRIDNKKITDRSEVKTCDFVIVLDETITVDSIVNGLSNGTTIIINTKDICKYRANEYFKTFQLYGIDATKIAIEFLGVPMVNVVMIGAFARISNTLSITAIENAIRNDFKSTLVDQNLKLLNYVFNNNPGVGL
jgi:pyruvate ferredoxin oxidoreductase gamma subunit